MMIIFFVRCLTYEMSAAVFPEGTIVRKPRHCDFPAQRGGKRSRIAETAICSATTTPRRYCTMFPLTFENSLIFPNFIIKSLGCFVARGETLVRSFLYQILSSVLLIANKICTILEMFRNIIARIEAPFLFIYCFFAVDFFTIILLQRNIDNLVIVLS